MTTAVRTRQSLRVPLCPEFRGGGFLSTDTPTVEIIPAQHTPAHLLLNGGINPEQRAVLGFLANRRPLTRSAYEHDLKTFKAWTERMGFTSMLSVDRLAVQLYLEHLTEQGLAEATIGRRLGTAKLFLKWAFEEEIIGTDPGARVKPPKIDRSKQYRTWFSTVDFVLVLRAAAASRWAMDFPLLTLMGNTAIRVGELCALDVESIHRDASSVRISFIGKGNKLASIPLAMPTVAAVDRYLLGRTDGPLFLNNWNNRITRSNVADCIDRNRVAAGIPYRVTCHGIRRTTARSLAEHGADIFDIAEALRHSSPTTTKQSYIGDAGGRGHKALQQASDVFQGMLL